MLRKAFARALKDLREKRKISQTELSRLSDLNRTYLSLLERGHRSPSLNTVKKIAEVFDINPSELMTLVENYSDSSEKNSREEMISSALVCADMGSWTLNLSTGDLYHSDWWTERFGYVVGDDSFTLSSFQSLIFPDDIKKVELSLAHHLNGILPYHEVQYRIRTKSGLWKQIWCRGKIVRRNEFGAPEIMSGVHLDISNVDLKILERKEMEGMRLCGSKLAHEINNPLSIIKGNLQIIQQSVTDDAMNGYLNRMELAIERIASIISKMTESTSVLPQKNERQSLSAILDISLRRSLAKLCENQIVTIDKRYAGTEYFVQMDAEELARVFVEIFKNAFESSHESEALHVIADIKKENSSLVITIEDDGCGISPEHIPFISDMFFTTKDTHKHLGLGLSSSRCMIYRLGGTMDVSSIPGKGTKVTVVLPAVQ